MEKSEPCRKDTLEALLDVLPPTDRKLQTCKPSFLLQSALRGFFSMAHKSLLSVLINLTCFIYIYLASSHFNVLVLLSLKGGRHN